ncbi:MAG: hypothetical protein MUC64_09840 [Rubritepida sp.]|jgi:hypothetical protein|nr:hypothetical protein [Rubritepida sp.]
MDTVFVKPRRVLIMGILGGLAALAWQIAWSSETPGPRPHAAALAAGQAPAAEGAAPPPPAPF